jgi:hypothetical protein
VLGVDFHEQLLLFLVFFDEDHEICDLLAILGGLGFGLGELFGNCLSLKDLLFSEGHSGDKFFVQFSAL